jgi:hypothetical protein
VDAVLHGLGKADPLHTGGAGIHATGLYEVEHMAERVKRLEQAISEAVKLASPPMQEAIQGLQALRGIAQISAVTRCLGFRKAAR